MFTESDRKAPTSTGPARQKERKKKWHLPALSSPGTCTPGTSPGALKLDNKSPSHKIQPCLNCCSVCMGLRASKSFKTTVSHCPLDLPNTSLLAFKTRHHGNFLSGADATGCGAQCETWAPHSSGGNPTVVIFFCLLVTVLGMWVLMRTHLFSSSAFPLNIYIYNIYIY